METENEMVLRPSAVESQICVQNESPSDTTKDWASVARKSALVHTNIFLCQMENPEKLVFTYAVYFDREERASTRTAVVNTLLNGEMLRFAAEPEPDTGTVLTDYDGTFLFTSQRLEKGVSSYCVTFGGRAVKLRIMYRKKSTLKRSATLMKHLMNCVQSQLGYLPVHRKFVDPGTRQCVADTDIEIYGAYRIRLAQAGVGPSYVVDVTASLQRSTSVSDYFNSFNKEPQEVLEQQSLYGKFVTRFEDNVSAAIQDVVFQDSEWILLLKKLGSCEEAFYEKAKNWHFIVSGRGRPVSRIEAVSVLKQSAISAHLRYLCIVNFVKRLNAIPCLSELFTRWGIKICTSPIRTGGTVLSMPRILFGNDEAIDGQSTFWSTKTESPKPFFKSIKACKWQIYALSQDMDLAQKLVNAMASAGPKYGFRLPRISVIRVQPSRNPHGEKCRFSKAILANATTEVNFIMVVLPPEDRDSRQYRSLYQRLKQLCISGRSVMSQMVKVQTVRNRYQDERTWSALVGGLLSAINCKLGGAPWKVELPNLLDNVMIVGLDVWHDATGKKNGSIGAMSCLLGNETTKVYSLATYHGWRQEIFSNLRQLLGMALRAFCNEHGKLPRQVVVYRDGGNCRQTVDILKNEIPQMIQAISEFCEVQEMPLTVICVRKRINERFFVSSEERSMRNLGPGTVVDNQVTRKSRRNFFLTSKLRQKGTTVATHYEVLFGGCAISSLAIQEITNALCYGFYNWPGTYYVPCVVQYAHKLAASIAKIGSLPPQNWAQTMHFL